VLLKELAVLYGAAAGGLPDGLERSMQPTEYALRQREKPVADERKLEYWARQLEGAPFRVDLPTDRPRPKALSGRGDAVLFTISADVRTEVEAFARRHGATPFAVTTATLGLLLSRLSGQSDIVVGVPYANRERRALEDLVTCAAVTFALRIRVAEAESFVALVEAVASDTIDAISNIMPLWEIAANADIPGRPPVGFQYQNALETNVEFPGMTVAIEDLVVPAARGEFYSGLIPTGDVLNGYIEYSTDLWDRETVGQWADAYKELLRDAVEGKVNLIPRS
jgi:iturin family lipopeptide synthetase A